MEIMTELAPERQARLAQLTPKEQACLQLVGRHLSSKEIAAELGIAKTSVDTYCNRARAKLGVSDRYEAARMLRAIQRPDGVGAAARRLPAGAYGTTRRVQAAMVLAGGLVTLIAFGTLLSGLRALEAMKPVWVSGPPAHGQAGGHS